jgi:hypothetical protein
LATIPGKRQVPSLRLLKPCITPTLLGETAKNIDELAEEVQLMKAFRALPKERQLIAIRLVEALE